MSFIIFAHYSWFDYEHLSKNCLISFLYSSGYFLRCAVCAELSNNFADMILDGFCCRFVEIT